MVKNVKYKNKNQVRYEDVDFSNPWYDHKFESIKKHINDAHYAMSCLYHNSKVHVDYIIELRDQIRELGAEPLPYPEELLEEFIPD